MTTLTVQNSDIIYIQYIYIYSVNSDHYFTIDGLVGALEPWNFGNGIIIPTDEVHHFSEG